MKPFSLSTRPCPGSRQELKNSLNHTQMTKHTVQLKSAIWSHAHQQPLYPPNRENERKEHRQKGRVGHAGQNGPAGISARGELDAGYNTMEQVVGRKEAREKGQMYQNDGNESRRSASLRRGYRTGVSTSSSHYIGAANRGPEVCRDASLP